jgi:glyoxylase-like metal-dependent hydrolase (beta-lactamase superfamily II)
MTRLSAVDDSATGRSARPEVTGFFHEATFSVSYLVADPATRRAALIDTVLDYDHKAGRISTATADAVIDAVRSRDLTVDWVLETHVHADHLTAAPHVKEKLGGQMALGAHVTDIQSYFKRLFNAGPEFVPDGAQFDRLFGDGDAFRIGTLDVRVMHTPGHTPACISYVVGDAVFVGDTLFMPDYGTARCDFPGGSARQLYRSIQRILSLPSETRVFTGHDYGPDGRPFAWESSVADQRDHNKHVGGGVSEDDFVTRREARDKELDAPNLILPALQVNMRAGHLPPADDNGIVYLRIPLNQL